MADFSGQNVSSTELATTFQYWNEVIGLAFFTAWGAVQAARHASITRIIHDTWDSDERAAMVDSMENSMANASIVKQYFFSTTQAVINIFFSLALVSAMLCFAEYSVTTYNYLATDDITRNLVMSIFFIAFILTYLTATWENSKGVATTKTMIRWFIPHLAGIGALTAMLFVVYFRLTDLGSAGVTSFSNYGTQWTAIALSVGCAAFAMTCIMMIWGIFVDSSSSSSGMRRSKR